MNTLRGWLSDQLHGAAVTQKALAQALGASEPTIKRRDAENSYTAGEVVAAARHWRLNPVLALIDLGLVEEHEVVDAAGPAGFPISEASDHQLAVELADRLKPA